MTIKVIKTDSQHRDALKKIEKLWGKVVKRPGMAKA